MTVTVKSYRQEVEAKLLKNIRDAIARSGVIMQTEIKLQLNKGAGPPASSAGSPPHKRTGQLGQNVQIDLSNIHALQPSVRVGVNLDTVPYARIHELGGEIVPKAKKALKFKTDDGVWHVVKKVIMPTRPYFKPAVVLAKPLIKAEFTAEKLLR